MNLLKKIDEERCIDFSVQSNCDLFIEIFVQNKHRETTNNVQILNILGAYYYCIHNDYEKALEYWLIASEKSYTQSMINMGNYYMEIVEDYGRGLHWFLMAIETNNDTRAMISLGNYYLNIEMNFEKAFEYYGMAHKCGDCEAFVHMCNYYYVCNNIWCALKYAKLASGYKYNVNFVYNCPSNPVMFINNARRYDVLNLNVLSYQNKNKIGELCFRLLACIKKIAYTVSTLNLLENIDYSFDNHTINFYLDKCVEIEPIRFLPILINKCIALHDCERLIKYCKIFLLWYPVEGIFENKIIVDNLKTVPTDVILKIFENGDVDPEIFVKLMNVLKYSKFSQWKMLYERKNSCGPVLNKIMRNFETDVEIHIFKNKILRAKRFPTLNDCPICLGKNVLCIEMWCGHDICTDCYDPNIKCYLRCNDVFNK